MKNSKKYETKKKVFKIFLKLYFFSEKTMVQGFFSSTKISEFWMNSSFFYITANQLRKKLLIYDGKAS